MKFHSARLMVSIDGSIPTIKNEETSSAHSKLTQIQNISFSLLFANTTRPLPAFNHSTVIVYGTTLSSKDCIVNSSCLAMNRLKRLSEIFFTTKCLVPRKFHPHIHPLVFFPRNHWKRINANNLLTTIIDGTKKTTRVIHATII